MIKDKGGMGMGKSSLNRKFSIEDIGLYSKNAMAFLFMFIIPLLLACYLVFIIPNIIGDKETFLTYSRIVIAMMIASGLFGYIFIRRTIKALISIIKKAENLAAGGKGGEKIEVTYNDELKGLAYSFNTINSNLEVKIKELEYSQRLTRELFQQIGRAITGSQKVKALFDIIVHGMKKVLDTSSSFIALYDKDGILRLKAHSGIQKDLKDNMSLPDDRGIIGAVIKDKNAVVENKDDEKTRERVDKDVISYKTGIGCVPILSNHSIKGILGITDKAGTQKISLEDLTLLDNIASQVALCVENVELSKNIEETYYDTLVMLARIVEAKDAYSAGHLERVSSYVKLMADKLNIDEAAKKILSGGALLHDLGKVGIDDVILKKTGKLTPQEYEIMKQHTVIGENILKPLQSMSKLSMLVRNHHELYDGSGYPDGLKGEEIPLLARILTIADIYDAITTDRPYRKMMSRDEAIKELRSSAGNKLDPKLVETFIELIAQK